MNLRKRNCKDVNDGSTCSPSTARPGTSKHGWGLAIDLSTSKIIGNVFGQKITRKGESPTVALPDSSGSCSKRKYSQLVGAL